MMAQRHALIVLASRGPQRIIDIAADLAAALSATTCMCDRLTAKL